MYAKVATTDSGEIGTLHSHNTAKSIEPFPSEHLTTGKTIMQHDFLSIQGDHFEHSRQYGSSHDIHAIPVKFMKLMKYKNSGATLP